MSKLELNAGVMLELITGASVGAAPAKDFRQHLTGVNIAVSGGVLRVAGTDGAKLIVGEYATPTPLGDEFNILVSPNGVKLLIQWLKDKVKEYKNNPQVSVTVTDSGVFSVYGIEFCPELLGISFPAYEGVIPDVDSFNDYTGATLQGFNAKLLADIAKVPNDNNGHKTGCAGVRFYVGYNKRPSLVLWRNSNAVLWRVVIMPLNPNSVAD